jgi:(2R)-3-sulfolactate dehydrogenase (NADP+)
MRKTADQLFHLAARALTGAGAHEKMAQAAARHLVRAEEQGLATHGMSRVPFYVAMLQNDRADGAARPRIVNQRPGACLIDNADGLPYESCELAIGEVIARAKVNGVGLASITNSNHVGVLGIHLTAVTGAGMAGLAFTNSPAAIPAWGGKRALFGTNPIAAAFAREGGDPLVIDLALSTVVRGKIMMAAQKGERIPQGWALDRDGRPTTDPMEALEKGSLFPIGGAKGAMLALAFELLCSALAGAHIGREADSFFAERGNKPRVGQLFMAIDPGALAGRDVYAARIEALVAAMLEDPEVRLPGARRFAAERRARAEGIEVADDLLMKIEKLALR